MKKNIVYWGKFTAKGILTLGASLTIGLLSFGGFYAIYPSVILGMASFALATLYEGQIYNSNIHDALKKLLKPNFFNQDKANQALEELLCYLDANPTIKAPAFIKDYRMLVNQIETLQKASSNPENKKLLKKKQKELKAMKRYFARVLFNELSLEQPYAKELKAFIESINNNQFQKKHIDETKSKKKLIHYGLYFSAITSVLFSLGSVYLILETLATLSFLTLPLSAVVLMATVCGTAYGFLIYNSLSDMIWNDTLSDWAQEVKDNIKHTSAGKAALVTVANVMLVSLGLALTVFTAGTWWSIAKNTKHLPNILKKIPLFVTAGLIPLFTGLAALVFTLENTRDSVKLVLKLLIPNKKDEAEQTADAALAQPKQAYPLYQRWNPFNLLITLIELPLRVAGFVLHIGSIGVTTDRLPGLPALVSAALSMISEGFEDLHYFVADSEDDHEEHNHDLPTQIIKFALSPLYILSTVWHWVGSKFTNAPISFKAAWQHRFDHDSEHADAATAPEADNPHVAQSLSPEWHQQKALMQLSSAQSKITSTSDVAEEKRQTLKEISQEIGDIDCKNEAQPLAKMHESLSNGQRLERLSIHRSTFNDGQKPQSAKCVDELAQSFSPSAANPA